MDDQQAKTNQDSQGSLLISRLTKSLILNQCEVYFVPQGSESQDRENYLLYFIKQVPEEETSSENIVEFRIATSQGNHRFVVEGFQKSEIINRYQVEIRFEMDSDHAGDEDELISRVYLQKDAAREIGRFYKIDLDTDFLNIRGHLRDCIVWDFDRMREHNNKPFFDVLLHDYGNASIQIRIDEIDISRPVVLWYSPLVLQPNSSSQSSNCFIATACGTDLDSITTLQEFRDSKLKRSWAGRAFVVNYEKFSPPVAAIIARSPFLSMTIHRGLIKPIVFLLRSQKK